MAVLQPPPTPTAPIFTPPPAKKSGCAGCGVGCLGCLGVFAVVVLLLVGGGWYFLVVQAQAGVPSPAALVVYNAPVEVGRNDSCSRAAIPGEPLTAGAPCAPGAPGTRRSSFPTGRSYACRPIRSSPSPPHS